MGRRLRMITGFPPHPDPSPSVEGRGAPVVVVCVLAAALALSACGKKGELEQREGVKPVYPRTYPTR